MKKHIAAALAALMLLPLLCGCGASDPAEKPLTTVRLNEVTHSVFYAPQYVALELGFFQESPARATSALPDPKAASTFTIRARTTIPWSSAS